MRTEVGAGAYRTSWNSKPADTDHLADLAAVCWLVATGLSLTVLSCALGFAEGIGQALASSG